MLQEKNGNISNSYLNGVNIYDVLNKLTPDA